MNTISPGYYQHKYGGLYYVSHQHSVTLVDSNQLGVLYQHIYPFPEQQFVRPVDQWTPDRFTLLTASQALAIFSIARLDLIDMITENKLKNQKIQ